MSELPGFYSCFYSPLVVHAHVSLAVLFLWLVTGYFFLYRSLSPVLSESETSAFAQH